jgi:AraC-like DNA-binding protein
LPLLRNVSEGEDQHRRERGHHAADAGPGAEAQHDAEHDDHRAGDQVRDPQIGRALTLIHRDPAQAWTVASLADAVAMSRSAFAARFTDLAGEPAMQYVARWRVNVALAVLEGEGATVAELADRLGHRSQAAFARAFKRVIGRPPGAVRRSANGRLAGAA